MKNGNGNGKHPSPTRSRVTRRVILYPSRKVIEVAPDIKMAPLAKEDIPDIAIARLQSCGDGTYRPVLKIYEPTSRAKDASKALNIPYRTLLRLCRAGFVQYEQIAPNNYQVSLSSWFEHVDRVRKDPEFWSHPKNMQRYRDAL